LVTHEQAVAYCQWSSEVVSKKLGIIVNYRLPTVKECEEIAQVLLRENEIKISRTLK